MLYFLLSGFTVIAHRGEPEAAPEQTFASFDAARADGADMIEFDVHLSADGVPIVQHDDNLKRMTGAPITIATTKRAKIQSYHTKNGEPVHTLAEVLARYKDSSLGFLIETKRPDGATNDALEKAVAAVVAKSGVQDRVTYHSFSITSLRALAKIQPDVPRFFIAGSLRRINYQYLSEVTGVNISQDLVSPDLLASLHAMGKQIYVWDELEENYGKWKWLSNDAIDGIITNRPKTARRYNELIQQASITPDKFEAVNTSTDSLPVYYNPYDLTLRKDVLAPKAHARVRARVRMRGQWYDQIGENRFVLNTTMTAVGPAGWANTLIGRNVEAKSTLPLDITFTTPARSAPSTSASVTCEIVNHTPQKVTAVSFHNDELWIRCEAGWLPGDALTFPAFADKNFFGQNPTQKSVINEPLPTWLLPVSSTFS